MPVAFYLLYLFLNRLFATAVKEDVVNVGYVASGDVAVFVLITVNNGAVVLVEQPVVKSSNVSASNEAVAVHVAINNIDRLVVLNNPHARECEAVVNLSDASGLAERHNAIIANMARVTFLVIKD